MSCNEEPFEHTVPFVKSTGSYLTTWLFLNYELNLCNNKYQFEHFKNIMQGIFLNRGIVFYSAHTQLIKVSFVNFDF